MKQRYPKYVMSGWRMLISTNNWRPVDIYFRVVGHSIQLLGCDVFNDEKEYIGWVVRDNISIEVQHQIKAWLKTKKAHWQRLHSSEPSTVN